MTGVPFTFGTATTAIPLSELDICFATPITIGSSSVGLGNTISTLSDITLGGTIVGPDASDWKSTGLYGLAGLAVGTTIGGWNSGAMFEAITPNDSFNTAVSGYNNQTNGQAIRARVDNTGANLIRFDYGASTAVGTITTNGSIISVNGTCDPRAKNDFGRFEGAGDIVDNVPVHLAAHKTAPEDRRAMFMAPEMQARLPYSVTGEVNAVDDKGEPVWQQLGSIDPLVPILWAALQETRARLVALENK